MTDVEPTNPASMFTSSVEYKGNFLETLQLRKQRRLQGLHVNVPDPENVDMAVYGYVVPECRVKRTQRTVEIEEMIEEKQKYNDMYRPSKR